MGWFSKEPVEEPISGQLEIDLIMSARKAVEKVVKTKLEISLDGKPVIEQKPVVHWQGKMKILRPSDCVFVSAIVIDREKTEEKGIAVLFIPDTIAETIAGSMGVPRSEGIDGVMRGCGEFLNEVAERFKHYLDKLEYEEIKFSEPVNFSSQPSKLFEYDRSMKFELTFFKKEEKFVQLEVGIGPLKKK